MTAIPGRKCSGYHSAEFAACLVIVLSALICLLDLLALPLRCGLAQAVLDGHATKLARLERASLTVTAANEIELSHRLAALGGVTLVSHRVDLVVHQLDGNSTETTKASANAPAFSVEQPGRLPSAWLPGGSKSPCAYELHITAVIEMQPFIGGKQTNIEAIRVPGLNAPVRFSLSKNATWENRGRDPATTRFYVDE